MKRSHRILPAALALIAATFAPAVHAQGVPTGYTDGNDLAVTEISNSWSSSEFSGETSDDSYFSGEGVAYFLSSGDSGAPAQYPSASPYVISVGGTTLKTDRKGNFSSETGWSLTKAGKGGGGPSAYESRPSFQNGIWGVVKTSRGTPDIASAA